MCSTVKYSDVDIASPRITYMPCFIYYMNIVHSLNGCGCLKVTWIKCVSKSKTKEKRREKNNLHEKKRESFEMWDKRREIEKQQIYYNKLARAKQKYQAAKPVVNGFHYISLFLRNISHLFFIIRWLLKFIHSVQICIHYSMHCQWQWYSYCYRQIHR